MITLLAEGVDVPRLDAWAAFVEERLRVEAGRPGFDGLGAVRHADGPGSGLRVDVVVCAEPTPEHPTNSVLRYEARIVQGPDGVPALAEQEDLELLSFRVRGRPLSERTPEQRLWDHVEGALHLPGAPRGVFQSLGCHACEAPLTIVFHPQGRHWVCWCSRDDAHFSHEGWINPEDVAAFDWWKAFEIRRPTCCASCGSAALTPFDFHLAMKRDGTSTGGAPEWYVVEEGRPHWKCLGCGEPVGAGEKWLRGWRARGEEESREREARDREVEDRARRGCGTRGPCPSCGFSYAYDGERCSHCR